MRLISILGRGSFERRKDQAQGRGSVVTKELSHSSCTTEIFLAKKSLAHSSPMKMLASSRSPESCGIVLNYQNNMSEYLNNMSEPTLPSLASIRPTPDPQV